MNEQPEKQEKKIIVDEDWKARVQAEKEAARAEAQREAAQKAQRRPEQAGPLPPPDLSSLVSGLAMQAMVALGLVPDPVSGKTEVHLDQAKHLIDTIAMLEEKTEGNRTAEESALMARLLHELRMGYVTVQSRSPAGKSPSSN